VEGPRVVFIGPAALDIRFFSDLDSSLSCVLSGASAFFMGFVFPMVLTN
jgi:hypothetical protein